MVCYFNICVKMIAQCVAFYKKSEFTRQKMRRWPEQESNQRHKDFQSFALPTELSGQPRASIFR